MMLKLSIAAIVMAASVYAGNLTFESGTIKAHTEVFGDSTIDPVSKKATAHLMMDYVPSTLEGSIEVGLDSFISDNKKRDENMHEALESSTFPKAVFQINNMTVQGGGKYTLIGTMTLHGVSKAMNFEGTIAQEENKVHIKAAGTLKMSDFGIKPIKLMFLTVRDQVDVSVDILLKR